MTLEEVLAIAEKEIAKAKRNNLFGLTPEEEKNMRERIESQDEILKRRRKKHE